MEVVADMVCVYCYLFDVVVCFWSEFLCKFESDMVVTCLSFVF